MVDCSVSALEDGTTTMLVGVTDDNTDDTSELSRENVGKGREEIETTTELVISADGTTETELGASPDCELASEDAAELRLDICGIGTGIR